ncbi:hypothetical protein KI387_001519, partial [Taxus chinensis]
HQVFTSETKVDYEIKVDGSRKLIRFTANDWCRNLETIKQWSPFFSETELLQQFNGMQDQGTRIILYNLWENDQGELELDFETDIHDIQVRGANREERIIEMAQSFPNSRHYLTYRHSLRIDGEFNPFEKFEETRMGSYCNQKESLQTPHVLKDPKDVWKMYFDGAKCRTGAGAGVIFLPPKEEKTFQSHRLQFICTNNVAEYEALVLGLQMAERKEIIKSSCSNSLEMHNW